MRKIPIDSRCEAPPEQARSRPLWIASMVLIAAVLTPLIVECASLYHAQWSEILGKSANAQTPILNWIHESLLMVRDDLRNFRAPFWSSIPRSQGSVLTMAAISIALGILVLRLSAHP